MTRSTTTLKALAAILAGGGWLSLGCSSAAVAPGEALQSDVPAAEGRASPSTVSTRAVATCANDSLVLRTVGLYFPETQTFYLQDSDGSGAVTEVTISGGQPSWIPVAGDWTGTGFDSVGLYDPSTSYFHLKNVLASGPADTTVWFGAGGVGLYPIAGDWTGKGYASVGVYDRTHGVFYLRNTNTTGYADITLPFGTKGDQGIPVAGDWLGGGISMVGLFEPSDTVFDLRTSNDPESTAERSLVFANGFGNFLPVVGRWTASSPTDDLALNSSNVFVERNALNGALGAFDAIDYYPPQGTENGLNPLPVSGRWPPTRCRTASQNTSPANAPWVKDLIVYEMRVDTFAEGHSDAGYYVADGGYFKNATALLPQLQDLGITAVSLNPVEQAGLAADVRKQNFYGQLKPDQIDSQLGTDADFAAFVAEAHSLGIKVIVDNVLHGISPNSPYVKGPNALPSDFYGHNADGGVNITYWGTAELDWNTQALRDWWAQNVGVAWVQKYDIDGFRMDLEPAVAGPTLWTEMRAQILAATGKTIALIPEGSPKGRAYLFDVGQGDVGIGNSNADFYDGQADIVQTIKSSPEDFYSNQLSCHDTLQYAVQGRLSAFAYGALISPYLPRWFMGEEFNATAAFVQGSSTLYWTQLNWNQKATNNAFYQQVKKLIQIRKQYQSILAPGTGPLQNTNIVEATKYSGVDLPPYSIWNGDVSITVVANRAESSSDNQAGFTLAIDAMGMGSYPWFRVTDLMTDTQSFYSQNQMRAGLTLPLAQGGALVLKAEGIQTPDINGFIDKVTENANGTYTIYGWVCSEYVDASIGVHVYLGNADGTSQHFLEAGTANLPSEPAVAAACQANGSHYRFQLPLGLTTLAQYPGQTIYVHGLSALGLSNFAITAPHPYLVP